MDSPSLGLGQVATGVAPDTGTVQTTDGEDPMPVALFEPEQVMLSRLLGNESKEIQVEGAIRGRNAALAPRLRRSADHPRLGPAPAGRRPDRAALPGRRQLLPHHRPRLVGRVGSARPSASARNTGGRGPASQAGRHVDVRSPAYHRRCHGPSPQVTGRGKRLGIRLPGRGYSSPFTRRRITRPKRLVGSASWMRQPAQCAPSACGAASSSGSASKRLFSSGPSHF